ncbi:hypothetical protein CLIM01_13956 [Colletotrichum limetticola]|uniref:Uncharacterized protein n=1 Tax=Colletotrichum limetticola TaxID=1209924 RepID=A0ABQ9PC24_9PEZI|nr:hypothetical protein CLIM01_13956 [Colletotrichum limetticola]
MALKDPFTYLFSAIHFCLIIAQSYKDFFPSILATLGFGATETYLIQAPPPIIAFLVTLAVSWSSGRMLEHGYHIIVPMLFTLAGCVVMITTLNVGARYFSMILLVTGPFLGLNTGGGAIITGCGLTVIFVLITKWYCWKKNKDLDEQERISGETSEWRYAS